ncbi:Uncharacterised protein [Yersinia pseudotuberculosis]|nr:hypothetical protein BZ19_1192 [Yersinia pseudotuberculosis str. PA3606]CNB09732.1 Uncharacterised protein [Yersinia similis]CNF44420.1 Uncharacterised protein [Yersinia similis]CNH87973.1 Uncharacterised protein [Yersinia pseudotuberculosis]CNI02055.1 Uncharacterised protein [Yersinia pseudotuberculosis]
MKISSPSHCKNATAGYKLLNFMGAVHPTSFLLTLKFGENSM